MLQSIHFSVLPCRNSENNINPGFIYLALVTDDGTIVDKESIRTSAWRDNENNCQEYWKHILLTRLKGCLTKASNKGFLPSSYKYKIDDAIFDEWYRWYYYIDGEDAHEYLLYCNASQHTTNWQNNCGVIVGWKFFKKLREHDFNPSTAAMLAYARGYLTGMESNSPWDSEGMEALHCLGLSIKGGSDALRAF